VGGDAIVRRSRRRVTWQRMAVLQLARVQRTNSGIPQAVHPLWATQILHVRPWSWDICRPHKAASSSPQPEPMAAELAEAIRAIRESVEKRIALGGDAREEERHGMFLPVVHVRLILKDRRRTGIGREWGKPGRNRLTVSTECGPLHSVRSGEEHAIGVTHG